MIPTEVAQAYTTHLKDIELFMAFKATFQVKTQKQTAEWKVVIPTYQSESCMRAIPPWLMIRNSQRTKHQQTEITSRQITPQGKINTRSAPKGEVLEAETPLFWKGKHCYLYCQGVRLTLSGSCQLITFTLVQINIWKCLSAPLINTMCYKAGINHVMLASQVKLECFYSPRDTYFWLITPPDLILIILGTGSDLPYGTYRKRQESRA